MGWGGVQGLGRGGPRASVPGGVGGRGTGPRDGANFATCARTKTFFEGCGVGGGTRAREGGSRGFGSGGVGGRGPQGVVFLTFLTRIKRRKMIFFEGYPVGWEGCKGSGGGVQGLWFWGGRW